MFNIFRKHNPQTLPKAAVIPIDDQKRSQNTIDIPENIFIDKNQHNPVSDDESLKKDPESSSIEVLFDFLDQNYEKQGYDDALMNPDTKHLAHNLEALRNQLERTIRRVKTFYEDFIKEIEFHIDSRARSGMVDVVDELKMKKSIAESHIEKVRLIEEQAKNNTGDGEGIIISYTKGFMNGLSAISHHSILKRF